MKWFVLVVMMAAPGERVEHYLYKNMPFKDVDECRDFATIYWQPLTNLASMKHGRPWGNMFCIPENNANSEVIDRVLNGKGI